MKYTKTKLWCAALCLCVLVAAAAVWRLLPPSASGMRSSAVIVSQTSWHEVCIDGKPQLYFSSAVGDTVLLGVTANRDSASHRKLVAGCWTNRWPLLPSCFGRVTTVYCGVPKTPQPKGDSAIVRLCRQSIATQLKTLKAQKTELDYYLRVHGVQDNGYQTIASLAQRVGLAYNDVARAGRLLDSLSSGKRHRFAIKTAARYAAIFRDNEGRLTRVELEPASADSKRHFMTLHTADSKTPGGVTPLSPALWNCHKERDIRAVGFPGLGEAGLECDTVPPAIIAGHKSKDGRHDLPRILASDGSPVFTAKGTFIGIVAGNEIAWNLKEAKK